MATSIGKRTQGTRTYPANNFPLAYVQMTGFGVAALITGVPDGASFAMIQAEAQDVRYADDGSTPTATVGMLLKAGQNPTLYSGDLSKLKVIAAVAGAILNISYYG